MTDVGNFFVNYLANSLWQLPLLALTAYLLERFVRRVGPLAQHRLWATTLFAAATIPALGASANLFRSTPTAAGVISYVIKMGGVPESTLVRGSSIHLSTALFDVVLVLYFLVALFAAARLVKSLLRVRAFVREGKPVTFDVHADSGLRTLCGGGVALLSSEKITTPVTIGWSKPVLFVPADFENWHPDDAAAALAHECAHIDRHDFLWNLIYEILLVLVSYHPVSWLLKSRIAATRETVCDAIAAGRTATPASYARALLRIAGAVSVRPATAPAIGMFDGNVLEKRVMELIESRQLRSKGPKVLIIVVAVAVFAAVCVGANAFSTNVEQKPDASDVVKSDKPLPPGCYKVGGDVTEPKPLKQNAPVYPPKAKEEKRTGKCVLEMIIDEKGVPQDITVTKSLAQDFDESAVSAVKQWRFSPATLKGKPVPVRITTQINFHLY